MYKKIITFLLFVSVGIFVSANEKSSNQSKVSFVLNLVESVTWPNDNSSNFTIGVYGDSELANALSIEMANENAGIKTVIVNYNKVEDINSCQVLFIGEDKQSQLKKINNRVAASNILLVVETIKPDNHEIYINTLALK